MKTKTLAISYPSKSSHVKWANCGVAPNLARYLQQRAVEAWLDNDVSDSTSGLVDVTVLDEEKAQILDSFSFWYEEN